MTTDAKPKTVQVGDPITVTSTITGRGNFDRVSAPELENESGWHKYPPSSKFTQDDDVGISGSKSFETVLSPNEKKHDLPLFVFSYFDPVKENYVTLRSDTIPIIVEGGASSDAERGFGSTGVTAPGYNETDTAGETGRHSLSVIGARPSRAFVRADLYAADFLGGAACPVAWANWIGWLEDSRGEN